MRERESGPEEEEAQIGENYNKLSKVGRERGRAGDGDTE